MGEGLCCLCLTCPSVPQFLEVEEGCESWLSRVSYSVGVRLLSGRLLQPGGVTRADGAPLAGGWVTSDTSCYVGLEQSGAHNGGPILVVSG